MSLVNWPSAILLSVLVVCTAALVWKGTIPSHAFFAIGGAIAGWLIPRQVAAMAAARERSSRDGFSKDEVPTQPDIMSARTQPMAAKTRDILRTK